MTGSVVPASSRILAAAVHSGEPWQDHRLVQ